MKVVSLLRIEKEGQIDDVQNADNQNEDIHPYEGMEAVEVQNLDIPNLPQEYHS